MKEESTSLKNTCIHCNYPLKISYKFCPNCSQKTVTKRLTVVGFLNDFFSSTISYDSRGMRTVFSMIKKPGDAALNFVKGDRVKYVNPFRIYLYISFLFFFTSAMTNKINDVFFNEGNIIKPSDLEVDKNKEQISLKKGLLEIGGDSKLDSVAIETLNKKEKLLNTKAFDSMSWYKRPIKIVANFSDYRDVYPDKTKAECFAELGFKDNYWNNYYYKKSDFDFVKNKENFQKHFFEKVPLLLFFNIPVISLLLLLVQIRQPYNFTENMILMFHYMSIVFLFLLLAELIEFITHSDFFYDLTFSLLAPIFFYKSLRNFYQQSRLKSILKFVILSLMFMISLSIMIVINFVFLFLTY